MIPFGYISYFFLNYVTFDSKQHCVFVNKKCCMASTVSGRLASFNAQLTSEKNITRTLQIFVYVQSCFLLHNLVKVSSVQFYFGMIEEHCHKDSKSANLKRRRRENYNNSCILKY